MNKTNKVVLILLIIIILLGGIYLISQKSNEMTVQNAENSQKEQQTTEKGKVVFSVTDATTEMKNISEVNMQISKVEMHDATGGWTTVSTTPHSYDLLKLNTDNQSKLLTNVDAYNGTYDQVRIQIDSVKVKDKSGNTKEAKMPSSELTINTKVNVNSNETSSVNFDFLASESLFTATNNEDYVFAPVVKTETKSNANINIDSDNVVLISGGQTDDTNTIGMDLKGNLKLNFKLDAGSQIKINNDNTLSTSSKVDVVNVLR